MLRSLISVTLEKLYEHVQLKEAVSCNTFRFSFLCSVAIPMEISFHCDSVHVHVCVAVQFYKLQPTTSTLKIEVRLPWDPDLHPSSLSRSCALPALHYLPGLTCRHHRDPHCFPGLMLYLCHRVATHVKWLGYTGKVSPGRQWWTQVGIPEKAFFHLHSWC